MWASMCILVPSPLNVRGRLECPHFRLQFLDHHICKGGWEMQFSPSSSLSWRMDRMNIEYWVDNQQSTLVYKRGWKERCLCLIPKILTFASLP